MCPVREVLNLLSFLKPYRQQALAALALLMGLVLMDLSIPRLVQRIIDQEIFRQDQRIVFETASLMLAISRLGTVFALGNNSFSIRADEGTARDLPAALFEKIQPFFFGNLDRLKTSELLTRLTSNVNSIKALVHISLRIGTRAPLMMAVSLVLMTRTNSRLALMMIPGLNLRHPAILRPPHRRASTTDCSSASSRDCLSEKALFRNDPCESSRSKGCPWNRATFLRQGTRTPRSREPGKEREFPVAA